MEDSEKKKKLHVQMAILSAFGMFFVVDGHCNHSCLDIGGLIPYYSFHMPLFVMISGYFFSPGKEKQAGLYIRKKVKRLLLPYFLYNLFYGMIASLLRGHGFVFGKALSFHTLIVEPFVTGHQFEYNLASWFVPALFLVETTNLLLRKLIYTLGKPRKISEPMLLIVLLLLGVLGIELSRRGYYTSVWLPLVRTLFLIPFYQMGICYRQCWECRDRLRNTVYFSIILFVELLLAMSGRVLIYSVAFCSYFPGYLLPYVTAVAGTAFWLRVSRILADSLGKSPLVLYFGTHTYTVMMNHVMAGMLLKSIFAYLSLHSDVCNNFSFESWHTDLWYLYYPKGMFQFHIFYLIWCIMLPLAGSYLAHRGREYLAKQKWPLMKRQ